MGKRLLHRAYTMNLYSLIKSILSKNPQLVPAECFRTPECSFSEAPPLGVDKFWSVDSYSTLLDPDVHIPISTPKMNGDRDSVTIFGFVTHLGKLTKGDESTRKFARRNARLHAGRSRKKSSKWRKLARLCTLKAKESVSESSATRGTALHPSDNRTLPVIRSRGARYLLLLMYLPLQRLTGLLGNRKLRSLRSGTMTTRHK